MTFHDENCVKNNAKISHVPTPLPMLSLVECAISLEECQYIPDFFLGKSLLQRPSRDRQASFEREANTFETELQFAR